MNPNDFSFVLNGGSRLIKLFDAQGHLHRAWSAHDVGVGDFVANADEYGHQCKIPPGAGYRLGAPQACGPDSADGIAYGWWFTPIEDNAQGTLAEHGRAGLGIHGGGSASPTPFAPAQGWFPTLGCIRMQNQDNGMEQPQLGTLVYAVQWIQRRGAVAWLSVVWP